VQKTNEFNTVTWEKKYQLVCDDMRVRQCAMCHFGSIISAVCDLLETVE